jgi:hypothetical protein
MVVLFCKQSKRLEMLLFGYLFIVGVPISSAIFLLWEIIYSKNKNLENDKG